MERNHGILGFWKRRKEITSSVYGKQRAITRAVEKNGGDIMKELNSNITTELTEKLNKIYGKYFNDSTITFNGGYLGDKGTIFINWYLAKDEHELINGYKENDMFKFSCMLKNNGNDYLLENLSKCYFIKPQENWLAYSRRKLSFRKVKGNEQKIAESFEKFVIRLKEQLQADIQADMIHENYIELLKKKI